VGECGGLLSSVAQRKYQARVLRVSVTFSLYNVDRV